MSDTHSGHDVQFGTAPREERGLAERVAIEGSGGSPEKGCFRPFGLAPRIRDEAPAPQFDALDPNPDRLAR